MSLDREKSTKLLQEMRVIGLEINSQMNRVIGKNHKQFLIASAISRREIETETFQILLKGICSHFLRLLNGANGIYGRRRFLKFRRCVFLMNSKDNTGQDYHTEARLLDPTGKILENIKSRNETYLGETDLAYDQGFLADLKNDIRKEFGMSEDCIIAMFSYFLPCTQNDHMCSMLIGKYADISKTCLIVSYEMPFKTTDKELSLCLMTSNYILMIHPEYYTFHDSNLFTAQRNMILKVTIAILIMSILKAINVNYKQVLSLITQYSRSEMEYFLANACFLLGNTRKPVVLNQERPLHAPNGNQRHQIGVPCSNGIQNFQSYDPRLPAGNQRHQIVVPCSNGNQCFQSYDPRLPTRNQRHQTVVPCSNGNQNFQSYDSRLPTGNQGHQIGVLCSNRNHCFQSYDPRLLTGNQGHQIVVPCSNRNHYFQSYDPRLPTGNQGHQISTTCSNENQHLQSYDPRRSTGNQSHQKGVSCLNGNQYLQSYDPRLPTGNQGHQNGVSCSNGNQYFHQSYDPRLPTGNQGPQIVVPCLNGNKYFHQSYDTRLPTGNKENQIGVPCSNGNQYCQSYDPRLPSGNQGH